GYGSSCGTVKYSGVTSAADQKKVVDAHNRRCLAYCSLGNVSTGSLQALGTTLKQCGPPRKRWAVASWLTRVQMDGTTNITSATTDQEAISSEPPCTRLAKLVPLAQEAVNLPLRRRRRWMREPITAFWIHRWVFLPIRDHGPKKQTSVKLSERMLGDFLIFMVTVRTVEGKESKTDGAGGHPNPPISVNEYNKVTCNWISRSCCINTEHRAHYFWISSVSVSGSFPPDEPICQEMALETKQLSPHR
ncbi:hypothetical protein C0J52_03165, partial [Blattella germanica]